ncbi:MAG: hypothetical protein A3G30_06545 [Chlamydiae bacterium RIFCSPLOWO2_12_FULL_49_12]|nr:MAG: hypothetical protein A3G30_06545 [Chlamydiae bacterium RIFCSPLOWO2_12_FULL_49_12]
MKTEESYAPFALLTLFIASMGPLLFGYNTAIISGAILFLQESFSLTLLDKGMVVSIILLGAMAGAFASGTLTDRLGRRPGLIINGAIYLIGGYMSSIAGSLEFLLLARFILGIGVGITSQATPLYLSEIAPIRNRGAFVSVFQLSITIGILCAYFVGFGFAESKDWRAMFALSMIPAALLFVGMFFMVESPGYLMGRGRPDQALKVLKRLRKSIVWEEHRTDVHEANRAERFRLKALFGPPVRKVLFLGVFLSALQQVTGINTVIYYAPEILKMAEFTSAAAALLATVGIGIVNVIVTVVAVWILDKAGRRPLLLIGISGMVLSLSVLGSAFLYQNAWIDRIALIALMAYVGFFAISLGPITWVLIAEIFPLRMRAQGMAVAVFVNWGCNYLVSLTFLDLVNIIGSALTFFLYAVICVAAFLFTLFFIPETKGLTSEEIQKRLKRTPV